MNDELLIWGSILLVGLVGIVGFFQVRRARQRALWRSKRPIRVHIANGAE